MLNDSRNKALSVEYAKLYKINCYQFNKKPYLLPCMDRLNTYLTIDLKKQFYVADWLDISCIRISKLCKNTEDTYFSLVKISHMHDMETG